MIFATKTLQQLRFPIGDRKFISRRLTGEEELIYQEVSTLIQMGLAVGDSTQASVDSLLGLLQRRLADGEQPIDADWIAANLGPSNEPELMAYLRTGHRGPGLVPAPGEHWDLVELKAEDGTPGLDLYGRLFAGRALSYQEVRAYENSSAGVQRASEAQQVIRDVSKAGGSTDLSLDDIQNETRQIVHDLTETRRGQIEATATLLNARIADEGEPITAAWLLENFSLEELGEIRKYLSTGKTDLVEVETPKAEGDAPANVPIDG